MYQLSSRLEINGNAVCQNTFDADAFTLVLDEQPDHIGAVLTAKQDLCMRNLKLTCHRDYDVNDFFFANGYQSWSTTEELCQSDSMTPPAQWLQKTPLASHMTTAMSDYRFTEYGTPGRFHSFTFTYFRKRGSRFIELYGSRSERQGYTIFETDMKSGDFMIRKDVDGLELKAGQTYDLFDIAVIQDEYDRTFDRYFFDFLGLNRPKTERMAGYTSWYNYFSKVTEKIVLRDLDGMDRVKDLTQVFQIDDGYESAVGDWLTPDRKKFPHGMKPLADAIHAKGYKAGLWLAPLNAQVTSKVARRHPDWLIRDEKTGRPLPAHFGWGGAYALDIYNPDARDYIKHFFHVILEEWGYDMVKLDFLYSACIQPRNGKTRGELMCDAVDFLREACGNKIILGCGVPIGPAMGVFDACRIGPDANKAFYGNLFNKLAINNEIPSSRNAMVNSIFRRCLDGRAFANDPDVFFFRDTNLRYSVPQKLLLAKINDLTGSVLFISDNVGMYDEHALRYLRYFFTERSRKVELAEYINPDSIRISFVEEGTHKQLLMNLKDGTSNVMECMGK